MVREEAKAEVETKWNPSPRKPGMEIRNLASLRGAGVSGKQSNLSMLISFNFVLGTQRMSPHR